MPEISRRGRWATGAIALKRQSERQKMTGVEYLDSAVAIPVIMDVLNRDGAVVLRDQFDPGVAEAVLAELAPHFPAWDPASATPGKRAVRNELGFVPARSPASHTLFTQPTVLKVAEAVLGPACRRFQLGRSAAIRILPGAPAQPLSADARVYPIRLPGLEWQIGARWALDDITAENGAPRLVLGSHRGDKLRRPEEMDAVCAPFARGSVLICLGWTHCGDGANFATAPVSSLLATYSLGWLRPEANELLELAGSAKQTCSPALMRLLDCPIEEAALGRPAQALHEY